MDDFYAQRRPGPRPDTEVLVLSADCKGIVMRPEALREGTKRNAALKAAAGGSKLTTRLTGGEKLGRKRMAAVGAVYDRNIQILYRLASTVACALAPRGAA